MIEGHMGWILIFMRTLQFSLILAGITSCTKEVGLYDIPRNVTKDDLIQSGYKLAPGQLKDFYIVQFYKNENDVLSEIRVKDNELAIFHRISVDMKNSVVVHPTKNLTIVEIEGCLFARDTLSIRNGAIKFLRFTRKWDD